VKTLIVETANAKLLGELVTVGRMFCAAPDVLVLGEGELQGAFPKAFRVPDTLGANLGGTLAQVVQEEGYQVVLLSATAIGAGIAGPLAHALGAAIFSEVTSVTPDLVLERSLYGSKAVVHYKVESGPLVLTLKRKYFEPAVLEGSTATTALPTGPRRIELLEEVEEASQGVPLEDADVVVTGGRGIGAGENFTMLGEMAALLKGAVGASRGAVDEGWMPPGAQIGQTGKVVAPSVYFAVGVSGASQHLAGISNAKCVVAINKDNEANIFRRARFGIVGDYRKVVPALIAAIRESE
jgi:electron transfer flavoprotein alpha subunit